MTEGVQLLQINMISARDLAPVSRSMRTYAIVWVDPDRKMTTQVDLKGNNNPQWDDKFTFRVSPEFLNSGTATVSIEIYAESWIRDAIVGMVQVPACSIIPANPTKSHAKRAVALQVRRPSGRPQGILNIAVSVLDGNNRSMPLSGLGLDDKPQAKPEKADTVMTLRRAKSERSCSMLDDEVRPRSTCNGPGSDAPGGGSMCNSDVGPSPSVVAAAVAKGLYIPPMKNRSGGGGGKDDAESSILQWADEESEDGIMTKIEQWKTELNRAPGYDGGSFRSRPRNHQQHRRNKTEGTRLFRCFGKAYGFEFTIVCGADGKNGKKGRKRGAASSTGDTQSYISL